MSDAAGTDEKPKELAKAYDPAAIEEKWAAYWVKERLFDTAVKGEGKAFTMLLPPPNVTGRLHMGHMLNQTEMDILTRWHRMKGEQTLWVPGTDHAGIATQMMVEKQLSAENETTREELGREAFTARVWKWKTQYGGAITEQMRRLGASVDWSREYFTMDEDLSHAVKEAFVRLYEQGLIYRGAYIVNWDPVLQTAVSDLEVESEERVGKLYHISYPLADGTGSIAIATTRPETMLGDVAVAVNPRDERYKHLVGSMLRLPLIGREIPIIADDWADPEFGSGAVKVTPAHDPNDFAIGQRHGLSKLSILDKTAHIDLPGSPFHGLDRYEARARIVEQLERDGCLLQVKDHPMTVPVSQRSRSVIEPRLSEQWFIRIQSLADKAIAAVREGHIKFTPEMYQKTYFEWMENIHDWCISRQLWWGHRIPAWHCNACKAITVERGTPEHCSKCGAEELTQETDVLDTWFSSGLLPITVFGWPSTDGKTTADMPTFYPTTLLVTGFDILFFWVARMIMLSVHFMLDVPMPDGSPRQLKDAVPFREVYIHALVRDGHREKMSKTKGNVIDPIEIIQRFGTDAVRFTLASMASPGTDIAFSEARTEGNRAFANKIWNAARYVAMQFARGPGSGQFGSEERTAISIAISPETPLETRWIFSRLNAVAGEVQTALEQFRFDEAANALYQFFWGEFCDWYLELSKTRLEVSPEDQLTNEPYKITYASLLVVFEAALRLLSPFMPFLTEELWSALPLKKTFGHGPKEVKSIALARYPVVGDFTSDPAAEALIGLLQELIVSIRALRKETGVPEREPVPIILFVTGPDVGRLVSSHTDMLRKMARVSEITLTDAPPAGNSIKRTASFDVQLVYARMVDVAAERERLTKDLAKFEKGLVASARQLGNEAFIAKAPTHIVDGLKKQAEETRLLCEKTIVALRELDVD